MHAAAATAAACVHTGGSAAGAAFWSQGGRAVASQREKLRLELEELYTTANNLANYVTANRTGFRKILKKHDKLVSVRQCQCVACRCCCAVHICSSSSGSSRSGSSSSSSSYSNSMMCVR